MARSNARRGEPYGGSWTKEKLDTLESYLDAYTTALKKQKTFRLWYIDAFAGTGDVQLRASGSDEERFLAGSARRALAVDDRPFDRLVFIESDAQRYERLRELRREHSSRDVQVKNAEANCFLQGLDPPSNVRGVLFLDPFSTQVSMSTLAHVAGLRQFDTWILFPVSSVARLLPLSRRPEDVSPRWAECLDRVYGDDSWRGLYHRNRQQNLWGPADDVRAAGVAGLTEIYQQRLREIFGSRLLDDTAQLKNSTQSVLFEFMFCVGHPKGIGPAKSIAGHLLNKI